MNKDVAELEPHVLKQLSELTRNSYVNDPEPLLYALLLIAARLENFNKSQEKIEKRLERIGEMIRLHS